MRGREKIPRCAFCRIRCADAVIAPAVNAHSLVGGNSIAAFALGFAPGLEAPLPLLGVNAGESIVSIDRRPQNGFLYGFGFNPTA